MQISFVIPAHNEESGIGKTIEAILKQPPEVVKEIIVADNNCVDRTAEIARQYPKTKVVAEKHPGTNWARQAGLNAATGEIVAFIDADCWLTANWSEIALSILRKPGVAGVSGPYIYRDANWFSNMFTYWGFTILAYPIYLFVHYILRRGGIVLGGNVVAKRDALIKMGGLDTSFVFFGDDVNTGRRLRTVGKIIFAPRLVVASSARRFQREGYFNTTRRYFLNFIWVIFFNRPFAKPK